MDDYQTLKEKIENVERDCEPVGHQPAIKGEQFREFREFM